MISTPPRPRAVAAASVLLLSLGLAACGAPADDDVQLVGIVMPTEQEEAWVTRGNALKDQFESLGYSVDLRFSENDATRQVADIDATIAAGADVLIVGAVDGKALNAPLADAVSKEIPVIAYDRLILGTDDVDYYATFDNHTVGLQQATTLLQGLGVLDERGAPTSERGPYTIEVVAGSADDNNAGIFFDGAMSVLQPYIDSGVLVVGSGETDFDTVATQGWDREVASARLDALLAEHYGDGTHLDGILAPNDAIAQGAITSLTAAGYDSGAWPVITGQDAEVAAVRSIAAGEQYSTVYKDSRQLAEVIVSMGDMILKGYEPETNDITSYDNGVVAVPTYILPPVAVTADNYEELLIGGGFYTEDQIR